MLAVLFDQQAAPLVLLVLILVLIMAQSPVDTGLVLLAWQHREVGCWVVVLCQGCLAISLFVSRFACHFRPILIAYGAPGLLVPACIGYRVKCTCYWATCIEFCVAYILHSGQDSPLFAIIVGKVSLLANIGSVVAAMHQATSLQGRHGNSGHGVVLMDELVHNY